MDKTSTAEIRQRVNMQPAEQIAKTNKIRVVSSTSSGRHQQLPSVNHSWSSRQQEDDQGKATHSLGRRYIQNVTKV